MRTLKFRGWDKGKQQMFPVSDISFGDDGSALTVVFQTSPKGRYYHGLVDGENGILMQFTGLTDCSGKEIYEGDILKMEDATAKVVFWETPPAFGLDFSHNEEKWCEDWNLADDSERMEVIGTIYAQEIA